MAEDKRTELHRAKEGVAMLVACVVQTIGETDETFENRFLERLERAYRILKDDSDGNVVEQMELLSWTRSLLTGFDFVQGQGKPFLADD